MDSTTLTRQMRLQQWTEIIQARIESGLTVDIFCEQNDITRANYYYWLKKIRQNACDHLPSVNHETNKIVQVNVAETVISSPSDSNQSYAMRASINGVIFEFTNAASADLIHNALKVVNYAR